MRWIPSAEEERWQAVAALAGDSELTRARSGGWRSFSVFARIGFFVLGWICASALWGLFAVSSASPRAAAFVAGLASIGAAELLIQQTRWFRAGLDEALHWGGLMMIGFAFVLSAHEHVMFAIAGGLTLIAAVRLLNPLLSTVGLLLIAGALPDAARAPYCAALAVIALGLITRRIARPSVDHALAALVIIMPPAAYILAKYESFSTLDWPVAIALIGFAVAALVVGIAFRIHAPLIALFTTLAAVAFEMRNLTGMPLETRLIVWGTTLLVVAVALDRLLRTPIAGITFAKRRDDKVLALVELAGAAMLTPHSKPPETAQGLQTGGGSFGGGGATGDI